MVRASSKQNTIHERTTLYRIVFDSRLVKFAVASLFVFLLLQPVAPAAASFDAEGTEIDSNSEASSVEAIQETSDEAIDVADVGASLPVEVLQEESTDVTTVVDDGEDILTSDEGDTSASSTELILEDGGQEVAEISTTTEPTIEDGDTASSTPEVDTEVPEVLELPQEEVLPTIVPIATTTQDATTSEPIPEPLPMTEHNSHAYQFNTEECAVVGEGAFYCSSTDDLPDPMKDGVFAAPDTGGDLEIYVRLGGVERAITSNTIDDSAPYYDALSERIVWHALMKDRYQIFSYDLKSDEQKVLTDTAYNNMEPVAYGNVTLWQAWLDNNWEIMLDNGNEVVRLTTNQTHDVSPHMRGGYIVWQTQFENGWQVAVYDQKTNSVEYIESENGMKVENPRFVLVYDSTNGAGDVQTVGYDFDKKVTFALGSLPAELPDELPNPDQTGETRALIQNKQTSKEGENEVIDIPQIGSNNQTGSTSTSTNGVGTLDLSQGTSTVAASSTVSMDIIDVVIPSYTASTTESQVVNDIPDIVIPPVISTSTEEVR